MVNVEEKGMVDISDSSFGKLITANDNTGFRLGACAPSLQGNPLYRCLLVLVLTLSIPLQQPQAQTTASFPDFPDFPVTPLPRPQLSTYLPGVTVGEFDVDSQGSANYQLPIVVPPGTAWYRWYGACTVTQLP